jgi:hypothetical protein
MLLIINWHDWLLFLRQQHIFRQQQVEAFYWPVPAVKIFTPLRQQQEAAFYRQAPLNYIYKQAAHISVTVGDPFH